MASNCDVKQIYRGNSYLNVVDIDGMIGVWGSTYKEKTILALDGTIFCFFQFESDEYYDEWMEEHRGKYQAILHLKYDEEQHKTVIL